MDQSSCVFFFLYVCVHFSAGLLLCCCFVLDIISTILGYLIYNIHLYFSKDKNSIRDAHTPQPRETIFNTMRYRSSETVQRLGYFQSSVSVQIMFKSRK